MESVPLALCREGNSWAACVIDFIVALFCSIVYFTFLLRFGTHGGTKKIKSAISGNPLPGQQYYSIYDIIVCVVDVYST